MSQAQQAGCGCPTPVQVDVPGAPGADGTPGTNGTNAFSILSAGFTVPAKGASVAVSVDDNKWMVPASGGFAGQPVFVFSGGFFTVSSVSGTTQAVLVYLNIDANTATGVTVPAGAEISPSGSPVNFTIPLVIGSGGTGATTKAGAQASLGLGQSPTEANMTGAPQNLTTSLALITGVTLTTPATGLYLIQLRATVDFFGATYQAPQTITVAVVNTTQSVTEATTTRTVPRLYAQYAPQYFNFPPTDYSTAIVAVNLTAGDILQAQISVSQAAGAGQLTVSDANLSIVPLALA